MNEDVIVTKDLSKTYGFGEIKVEALKKTNLIHFKRIESYNMLVFYRRKLDILVSNSRGG